MAGKVKMVRFKNPTNRGMLRFRAGQLYPAGPDVVAWLERYIDPEGYTIVDAPAEEAATPDEMKPPKKSSRLASSRNKTTADATAETGGGSDG